MIQCKFAYTEKSQTDTWIATGRRGPTLGVVTVDELDLTPEQRAIIAPHLTYLYGTAIELAEYRPQPAMGSETMPDHKLIAFDAAPSLDDILAILPKMREQYQQAKSEVVKLAEQRKREAEEKKRRDKEFKEQQEAAEEAAKQQRLAERAAWVAAHGSERLRKCQERGYDCARLYLIERAALEYPGFVLDYNDSADWDVRKGPSLEALKREEELAALYPDHEIAIVWLTCAASNAPDRDEDGYDFEQHEAIVMRPPYDVEYLHKPGYGMCWLIQDL